MIQGQVHYKKKFRSTSAKSMYIHGTTSFFYNWREFIASLEMQTYTFNLSWYIWLTWVVCIFLEQPVAHGLETRRRYDVTGASIRSTEGCRNPSLGPFD